MQPKKFKPIGGQKRRTVLFVDDDPRVQMYTSSIAEELRIRKRTATSPIEAQKIIKKRLRAIRELRQVFQTKLKTEKNSRRKKVLQRKIGILSELEKRPFNLIVSDINMPRGHPTGVKFVLGLQKKLPSQKILMHSDDTRNLQVTQEEGIPDVVKLVFLEDNKKRLKREVKRTLWPKKNQAKEEWV
jgi:CheY-like chemotaxis protein